MSLRLYDEALKTKLSEVFDNVVIAPPERAFIDSNKNGKVKLPLISAYRLSNPINFEEYNRYEVFTGRRSKLTEKNEELIKIQGLPVLITYQIDIWAQSRDIADGIYRELVYYLTVSPDLKVQVPNADKVQDFYLKLSDVDTSTEYDSFDDVNTIHKYTLTYEIDEARLFFHKNYKYDVVEVDLNFKIGG